MITVIIITINLKGYFLKLTELKKQEEAIVQKVNANGELKQRLASFGLLKGANIKVIDCSLGKSTIEIMVDGTLLALRKSEAENIEVEPKWAVVVAK